MASRILGMGDVLSLIEKAEAEIDEDQGKTADSEDEEESVWITMIFLRVPSR